MTSDGKMKEWIKYSAYGIPFAMPAGDTDSDGDCDSTDVGQILTWKNAGHYDVRGDLDLDGDVDATDRSTAIANFQGTTLGWGVLSNVGNRKGYAGYERDINIGNLWHVRNRVYNAELGRWTRRDPLGYGRKSTLYEYVESRVLYLIDPTGFDGTVVINCPGHQDVEIESDGKAWGSVKQVAGKNCLNDCEQRGRAKLLDKYQCATLSKPYKCRQSIDNVKSSFIPDPVSGENFEFAFDPDYHGIGIKVIHVPVWDPWSGEWDEIEEHVPWPEVVKPSSGTATCKCLVKATITCTKKWAHLHYWPDPGACPACGGDDPPQVSQNKLHQNGVACQTCKALGDPLYLVLSKTSTKSIKGSTNQNGSMVPPPRCSVARQHRLIVVFRVGVEVLSALLIILLAGFIIMSLAIDSSYRNSNLRMGLTWILGPVLGIGYFHVVHLRWRWSRYAVFAISFIWNLYISIIGLLLDHSIPAKLVAIVAFITIVCIAYTEFILRQVPRRTA
ncbi:MAG: hypothetical protein HY286_04590 [Planctomycetes bacterium]|nr:hypothetical protein [Planctomycetota bacterium]